jgi:hypothetical protein
MEFGNAHDTMNFHPGNPKTQPTVYLKGTAGTAIITDGDTANSKDAIVVTDGDCM